MFVYKKIIAEKSCYGNRYFAVLTHHLKLMGLRPHYFNFKAFYVITLLKESTPIIKRYKIDFRMLQRYFYNKYSDNLSNNIKISK